MAERTETVNVLSNVGGVIENGTMDTTTRKKIDREDMDALERSNP